MSMSQAKRWLRGDPDRPFPIDQAKIADLLKLYKSHTHEPLWFCKSRGGVCSL
jgi:hypothetical protein